ncbi:MAG: hypothetical protein PHC46_00760 [Clostridia bacterium]|nr:hypothetical protein [Clostridia bacterium]
MKTKILSILVVFVLIASLLTGCGGFTPLTSGPAVGDIVSGNGGMSVRYGDYLYFVNGFLSSKALVEGANQYNEEENAAVYRAQLDASGELMTDEEGNLININILIPKIVGFENGGFFIFDNYIYYATPTILKDRTGTVRFDLVDFYMAKLDGTGIKKIYAATDYSTSAKFSFYKIGDTVHLVVFDGTQIINVKINGYAISQPITMVESATSVALPKVTEYNSANNTVSDVNKYIYYTRSLNDSDNTILELGNTLAKIEIGTTTEEVLIQDNIWSYGLGRVKNNALYYTKNSSTSFNSKNYYRSLLVDDFEGSQEIQVTGTYYAMVAILDFEEGNNRGVVVSNDTQLIYISDVFSEDGIEILINEAVTILLEKGDYVYYTYGTNNRLARINVKTKAIDNLTSEEDTLKVDITLKVDYDNEYIYVFKKHTNSTFESYYLERVKYVTIVFESEFVGVLETKDLPDSEETE